MFLIPRNTNYAGGTERPEAWKVPRKLRLSLDGAGGIVVAVAGKPLAPQDYDALTLFEKLYGKGNSRLTFDGRRLVLQLADSRLPPHSSKKDVMWLITETYESLECRNTIYTEKSNDTYYRDTYVMERRHLTQTDMEESRLKDTADEDDYELAPDVFVRPRTEKEKPSKSIS